VLWLQRDFGLYLVSLFDTFHASSVLQLPSRSLAYLLLKYANIEANKKYQLADWRIRPLPTEMLDYARSDTHYLLYIYDQIRRDLTTQSQKINVPNLITRVLDLSRQFAMMTYTRERYDYEEGSGVDGWRKLLLNNKGPHLYSKLQLTVFKRLHQWRDGVARQEDESTGYVIPNRALINLAASLPNSMQAVIGACHPVPPLVQVYAEDIAYIVAKTRKELAEEAEKAEIMAAQAIHGREETLRNGVTGSTHIWYNDEATAPNGVRSVMEAVKHGTQFEVWGDRKDRLHSLILPSSEFWEPLQQEYVAKESVYEVGGELEDIKLSVPLPPLTAQIYMTADDVKALGTKEEKKQENVAALAEHPFVQRSKEEKKTEKAKDGAEIIIARKMGKKEKGKRNRQVYELQQDIEKSQEDTDLDKYIVDDNEPVRTKNKSKRRKGLKAKIESETSNPPMEQFDPYKPALESRKSPAKSVKTHGPSTGKSMTFVTPKT
jgi:exosome complex exonuclease RRP6